MIEVKQDVLEEASERAVRAFSRWAEAPGDNDDEETLRLADAMDELKVALGERAFYDD